MQVSKVNNKNQTISEESHSTCNDLMLKEAKRKPEIGQSENGSN